eukprot:gnl/TRDRNA2_/TRDRNA2_164632_c0_seq2.p1 gnl/TRDRNA2_/TRDRNA2_164632_c0~~gnl/TRDRNA2_/TRDRNA2_164632_c0_seq2.p1  ORF type:complete len:651 (+),score=94.07 gnl/TRDRNA2_/TRDRNA2_164632_c0_seq2:68-1954(+)
MYGVTLVVLFLCIAQAYAEVSKLLQRLVGNPHAEVQQKLTDRKLKLGRLFFADLDQTTLVKRRSAPIHCSCRRFDGYPAVIEAVRGCAGQALGRSKARTDRRLTVRRGKRKPARRKDKGMSAEDEATTKANAKTKGRLETSLRKSNDSSAAPKFQRGNRSSSSPQNQGSREPRDSRTKNMPRKFRSFYGELDMDLTVERIEKSHALAKEKLKKKYALMQAQLKREAQLNKSKQLREAKLNRLRLLREAKLNQSKLMREAKLNQSKLMREAKLNKSKLLREAKLSKDKLKRAAKLNRAKLRREAKHNRTQLKQAAKLMRALRNQTKPLHNQSNASRSSQSKQRRAIPRRGALTAARRNQTETSGRRRTSGSSKSISRSGKSNNATHAASRNRTTTVTLRSRHGLAEDRKKARIGHDLDDEKDWMPTTKKATRRNKPKSSLSSAAQKQGRDMTEDNASMPSTNDTLPQLSTRRRARSKAEIPVTALKNWTAPENWTITAAGRTAREGEGEHWSARPKRRQANLPEKYKGFFGEQAVDDVLDDADRTLGRKKKERYDAAAASAAAAAAASGPVTTATGPTFALLAETQDTTSDVISFLAVAMIVTFTTGAVLAVASGGGTLTTCDEPLLAA